jgi:hypothetical protein
MEFGSAHCQTLNFRFRFAGFNLVADPESPFPDPGSCRWCDGVVDAFVNHGSAPFANPSFDSVRLGANCNLSLFHIAHFSNQATADFKLGRETKTQTVLLSHACAAFVSRYALVSQKALVRRVVHHDTAFLTGRAIRGSFSHGYFVFSSASHLCVLVSH